MANMSARRAFDCATALACPWVDARSEMLDNDSKPTAMTVSRIISESVTTRAKPLSLRLRADGWVRNGCPVVFEFFNFSLKEWRLVF